MVVGIGVGDGSGRTIDGDVEAVGRRVGTGVGISVALPGLVMTTSSIADTAKEDLCFIATNRILSTVSGVQTGV